MNDKVFIDTNLLIYYVADDIRKKNIVKALLLDNENIVISSQVINEFMAVISFPRARVGMPWATRPSCGKGTRARGNEKKRFDTLSEE
jgi:predicted nucleic acid-binding protein